MHDFMGEFPKVKMEATATAINPMHLDGTANGEIGLSHFSLAPTD